MDTFSTVDDLILGDLTVGTNVNLTKFVEDATNEIFSKIGHVYVLPLEPAEELGFDLVPEYTEALLKKLNNHLASGRLILALNATSGDDALNRYGEMLVRDALTELEQIRNGVVDLVGAARLPAANPGGDAFNGAAIINADSESAVDVFYSNVMGGGHQYDGSMRPWAPNR